MVAPNFDRLARKLGYAFNNKLLLQQALTHRSAHAEHNERLEFLGDSVLSYVISTDLYHRFPKSSEGELSRLRAHLVKGEMLAEIALEIDLSDYLILGQGELKSGGHRRASILADTLEAIFAAVFLDGGIEASQHVILNLFKSRLNQPNLNHNLKDAKTRLQEYLQAQKYPLPNYVLIDVKGEEHNQKFKVSCEVPQLGFTASGEGSSRRKAEQKAALKILEQLN